ncbi:hypothetical protein DRJ17_03645 [Candidatus Woesearchaeota archaeon]|nr:MAG: hypothetical protein DRJ17_03645 [Candidatus Woesearchaeota archaeon]
MKKADIIKKNIEITKKQIKKSVTQDLLLVQSIHSIDEINKAINILLKRLREWYELYFPEFSKLKEDNETFVAEVSTFSRSDLMKKSKIRTTMGADLETEDINAIKSLAEKINKLYKLRESQQNYLDKLAAKIVPKTTAVVGSNIAARLIAIAGCIKNLAMMPASTIQVLGAEKAFFRHLRTGTKMPKYGIILQHPLFERTPKKEHGKIARKLASKISISIKEDYFKNVKNV